MRRHRAVSDAFKGCFVPCLRSLPATCELLEIWRLSAGRCSSSKRWKSEAFRRGLGDEMHQPPEIQFCKFCRIRTAVQHSVIVVLLLLLFLPKSQAEELNHDEMVCALTGTCETPFVDRRVRGLTTSVSPRPPLSFDATVNFNCNSAELTKEAKKELDEVIGALKDPKVKDAEVIISGHTDATGSAEYNHKLSELRALMVKSYLVQQGIDKKRLTAAGYGKSKLLLPEQPNNALNRRVEFRNSRGVAANETIKAVTGDGF
jgi:outer membrane protein OmpA-like peptidoglycan-associated protein